MANGFRWGRNSKEQFADAAPHFAVDANALGLPQTVLDSLPPYRILLIVTPGGNPGPAVDNAGVAILLQQLPHAGLPPNINFALGAPLGQWFYIDSAIVP